MSAPRIPELLLNALLPEEERECVLGDLLEVVIVNRCLADRYFGKEDPLGRRIAFQNDEPRQWRTIVGVAGDEKLDGLAASPSPPSESTASCPME